MPGGFSPYVALMAQSIGFQAFFLAGSQVSAFLYGLPDVGVVGLREMVDHARQVVSRTDIPVLVDGDTGHGNVVNVHFAVQEMIRAGAAAIHIEDQESPKRSGTLAGRRCIPTEEAVAKYRAAVAARDEVDPSFVICARCDTVGAENGTFQEAVERSIAYARDGGVDLVWVNSIRTRDEIREVCRRVPGPVMVSYYGEPPTPTLEEWRDLGPAAVIFPARVVSAAAQTAWDFLNDLKADGPAAIDAWRVRTRSGRWGALDGDTLLGDPRVREIETKFLPGEKRRDYDTTFGH